MRRNSRETADLLTFTEEILNEKLPFFVQFLYDYGKVGAVIHKCITVV